MGLFTIGHSTHAPDEFLARCDHAGIRTIVDIRSHPRSRWEWFMREQMADPAGWLQSSGVGYLWMPALGGWSERQTAPNNPNAAAWATAHSVDLDAYAQGYFPKGHITRRDDSAHNSSVWTSRGLLDYAWYTALPEFQQAAAELIKYSGDGGAFDGAALMCSEFLWWKCHRSMVADYLLFKGTDVTHVQPRIAKHSSVVGNRHSRYPDQVLASWGAAA